MSSRVKLAFKTYRNAPCEMVRGAAVVHGNVGYFCSSGSCDVCAYDSEKDDWSILPECPQTAFGLAVINNFLTAVGGVLHKKKSTNRLVSFNGKKWVTIFPRMPTSRHWLTVISVQNYLIVAGGVHVERLAVQSTVEVMNIATREWYTAASLPEPVCLMSATVCGGRLYFLGGLSDATFKPTCTVFTCNLDSLLHSPSQNLSHANETSFWQQIADVPVMDSTCITLNSRLLAVGGKDLHGTITAAVHMYDADSNSWALVGHMSTAHCRCLVVKLKDCIIAVGGYISSDLTKTAFVEVGHSRLSGGHMVIIFYNPHLTTADCMSCKAEQWKTTIDLLCSNREEGHAEAGKIIRFIHGKSIVVFHCSACVLTFAIYCNLCVILIAHSFGEV